MPEFEYKARTYLHFDAPPPRKTVEAVVTDPEKVARHSFYPFLGFTIETPRISKDEFGKIEKDTNGLPIKKAKKRPIKLAAHMDAAICSYYATLLKERYERQVEELGLGECVTAFRKMPSRGRNNIYFANEVFEYIQNNRPCVAIGLDVEKFFDRLDHGVLKDRWQQTLGVERLPKDHFALYRYLTEFTWVDKEKAFAAVGISKHNPRPKNSKRMRICTPEAFRSQIKGTGLLWVNSEGDKGIPQGSPISALLSNIYMLDFDRVMKSEIEEVGGLYRRYCDDILLVVPPEHAERIVEVASRKIDELKLNLNTEKTCVVRFISEKGEPSDEGQFLQYLGFDFDGEKKLIRASSMSRYYGKMRRGVSLAKQCQRKENKKRKDSGQALSTLRTRQLQIRYSYLIRRRFTLKKGQDSMCNENFITYAYRAADRMNAPEIKGQVKNHWKKLKAETEKPL